MNILAFVILFLFLFWMAGFFLIWMFADTERHEFSIKIIGLIIITILTIPLGNGLFFLFNSFCTEKTVNYDVVTDPVYSTLADISGSGRYVYYIDGSNIKKVSEKKVSIKIGIPHLEVTQKKLGILIDEEYTLYANEKKE